MHIYIYIYVYIYAYILSLKKHQAKVSTAINAN